MNSQLISRLSQIKQYISTLNDTLSANDHAQASTTVSRFKKSMIKSDEQVHASQFVLDCLKTKNEKLRQELKEMQQQKKEMQMKLFTNKSQKAEIKQCKVQIFITRLTVTLNQCKKVDYDQVTIGSDYKNITVNSSVGTKYNNYQISIEQIQQLEHKANILYLCLISDKVYHILIKFKAQKQAMKWALCLKYGQMIIKNTKKKQKLFEEDKEIVKVPTLAPNPTSPISLTVIPPVNNTPPPPAPSIPFRNSMAKSLLNISQVPFINVTNQNKTFSPSQSLISQKRYNDKSFDREGGDRSGEKNTERSLVNAMNFQGHRSSGTFNMKDTTNNKLQKRLDLNRPPNLAKIRNSSSNNDYSGFFEGSKAYRASSGFRKQSQDFIKPHINQVYHQMMENYRPKDDNQDQIKSDSNFKMLPNQYQKLHSNLASPQKSSKIKMLQQKKKQLLKSNVLMIEKPSFVLDNKVSWMGIQEMDDENKSKSSNHISNKSRRGSEFSESAMAHSSEHARKLTVQQDHSQHITQKSQEQSPRLGKTTTPFEVPHKVSYNNGIVFQLHQVEKGVSSPIIPSKVQQQQGNSYKQETSSSSQSEDEHSDPSSHQNHTESQDNNARIQQLKKGITVTKCSQNGFWTHEKILYLSQNQNDLLTKDIKDKKIKKIKLANIKEVQYKKFDKGIIKHISKIEEDKCFVIRALDDDNKIKNFQFVSNLAQPLQRFATNLKLYVEYFKQQ